MILWNSIIDFVLKTQQNYLNLDTEQFEWLKIQIYNIYNTNIKIYNKYKCLVLLNRFLRCGRYCLIFHSKIEKCVLDKDYNTLLKIFEDPVFEELNLLSENDKNLWIKEIEDHILAHNLYMDRQIISQNQNYYAKKTDFISLYSQCYKEVSNNDLIFKHSLQHHEKQNKSIYILLEIDYIFLIFNNKIKSDNNKFEDILKICSNAEKLGYIHKYNF